MNRLDVWLGVVVGVIIGVFAGAFFGGSLGEKSVGDQAGRAAGASRQSASQLDSASVPGSEPAASPPKSDWVRAYSALFENAPENRPTPGITEAIGEALRSEGPFDMTRMLLLIEMMRKEDFPVALEVLRKAKTHMNNTSFGSSGPPVWLAFWQRFGERDPATALAKALDCGDLNYPARTLLEKQLFVGIARNSPKLAGELFLAHPELPNRTNAVEGIMIEWGRADLNTATQWARTNLDADALKQAYFALLWGINGKYDIARGNDFLKTIPEGPARDASVQSMKGQIKNKPYVPDQQIFDFVAVTRAIGARDRNFEAQIAARCAASDPHAAANFFSQPLAVGEQNDFAELRVVAARWIRQDAKAAANWAKGQERTPHYEAVADEFIRAANERNDAADAQRWNDAIAAQKLK